MANSLGLYLWIGLGSALGGMGRFWLSTWMAQRVGESFPWGTLAVNVSGSFAIGLLAALASPEDRFLISPKVGQFLMIGVCGGFTTFSAFSIQTLNLMRDGQWLYAAAYVLGSVLFCLAAVWCGFLLGHLPSR